MEKTFIASYNLMSKVFKKVTGIILMMYFRHPLTWRDSKWPEKDINPTETYSEYTPKIPLPDTEELLYPMFHIVGLGTFLMDIQYVMGKGYKIDGVVVGDVSPQHKGYFRLNARLEAKK
ncbi:TPA: hypothetical protein ACWZHV_003528 [Escherichia coli]